MADIQALAAKEGWAIPAVEGLNPSGVLPPLESSIDLTNIHGWLQGQITASETRYALLVTGLLKADPARLSALEELAYGFGQKHAIPAGTDAEEAYQALNDSLLDGMPCDHVNQIVDRSQGSLSWRRSQCLHGVYWEQAGGDTGVYYALREKLTAGMLAGSGLRFSADKDGLFTLREGA